MSSADTSLDPTARPASPVPRPAPRTSLLETSRLVALMCCCAVLFVIFRVMQAVPELGASKVVVDFDAFYITGQLIWEGRLTDAYDPAVTMELQSALASTTVFMPWTYPPQFDLVVALLPLASRGLAYGIFMTLGFAFFLYPLSRLAGRYAPAVLIAAVPALCFNTFVGQNGFFSAGLLGVTALWWLRGKDRAGLPLGLMIIKPHLAVTMGLFALAAPRWRVVAWAAAMVFLTSLLATIAFGPEVWRAFLDGTAAAKGNLAQGSYPLYRMTSVFAAVKSLGFGAGAALLAHLAVAFAALATVVWLARFSGWAPRRTLGFTLLLSLVISPYSYDYDTTIMAMGLAVLAPDLVNGGRPGERALLLALAWATGGAGMCMTLFARGEGMRYGIDWFPLSVGAYVYLPLIALVWLILARLQAEERAPLAARGAPAGQASRHAE